MNWEYTGRVRGGVKPENIMTNVWDYSVERGSLVTEAMLAGGKLTEVSGSLGNNLIIKFENNPSSRF